MMRCSNKQTSSALLVLLFQYENLVDLSQQFLAILLCLALWLPLVIEHIRRTNLFEELGPSIFHVGLVRFNLVPVVFFQDLWCGS
jgi:hypothetical protein